MYKGFRLPARKTCAWEGCNNETTPRDEIAIPFDGKTLLLSLCPSCLEYANKLPKKEKKEFRLQSFSGNGFRYVESIHPTKEQHEQPELQCR